MYSFFYYYYSVFLIANKYLLCKTHELFFRFLCRQVQNVIDAIAMVIGLVTVQNWKETAIKQGAILVHALDQRGIVGMQ